MRTTQQYDVAVLGLGAVGSMATWRAAVRGAKVIGIEQYGLAHARGSSHGGSRIFRKTLYEGPGYVPLVNRAQHLWSELEQQAETSVFRRSGGLNIGPPDGDLIAAALASARAGGFEHQILSPDDLANRYPQHVQVPNDIAVFEPGAGILNPEKSIRAAVTLAQEDGADVALETRVAAVHHDDCGVTIATDTAEIRARCAIIATGAWFTELVPELTLPLKIQKSSLTWFIGPDRAAYEPDRFPIFVRKSHDIDTWGIPDVDGRGVKVGPGSSTQRPWLNRPEDNVREIDESDTNPAEQVCARAFPGLTPVVVDAVPCMNSRTPDRDFVLGVAPSAPHLVLAGGFSGHGFKHAPASGDVAVDLALDGETGMALEKFSPYRFQEVVS